jgi:hypothetical protein
MWIIAYAASVFVALGQVAAITLAEFSITLIYVAGIVAMLNVALLQRLFSYLCICNGSINFIDVKWERIKTSINKHYLD